LKFLPLSTRILLGLIAGFTFGAIAPLLDSEFASHASDAIEPLGAVWLSALRLTVLPLVFALLVTGVGTVNRNASGGRIAARSMGLFVALLCFSALVAATLTPALLAAFPVDPAAAAALRDGAGQGAPGASQVPRLHDWLLGLMPSNIFEAAAKGDVLQVVIFALLFGFAIARVAPAMRDTLLGFFQAVVEVMLIIVRWVLLVAPIGVFALAFAVGRRGGFAAAGALGHYLVTVCVAATVVTLAMYPLVRARGGMPMGKFARAVLPAQVLGFSTQSSLACLSAMIDVARSGLRIAPSVSAVTLPMAVSLFRFTSPVVNLSVVLFVAHVSGVHIGIAQLIAGVTVAVVTNFAIVGLPSQITFFTTTVPISFAMGVPTGILPLLLAIEVIPDLFRTVGNVTADLAVTLVAARGVDAPDDPDRAAS
jgi:Na+/H+-dicarboxylate symporter